jgi:hypothetical protein
MADSKSAGSRLRWFESSPAHTSPPRKLGASYGKPYFAEAQHSASPSPAKYALRSSASAERRRALTLPLRTVELRRLASSGLRMASHTSPKPNITLTQVWRSMPFVARRQPSVGGLSRCHCELWNRNPESASTIGSSDFPRRSLPDVPSSTVRVTQRRGQRLLNYVVYRLGDDLVPDPGRMGGIPEKVLIRVRHDGATMR